MDEEEPAWRAELRGTLEALTEWAYEKGPGLTKAGLDLVLSHIKAAEKRGRDAPSKRWADVLKADWSRYRGSVLEEVWKAMRDAEGGPLLDAMRVVNDLMERRP
jgi:hypothetical protein